jgi:RNA polymerase sigma-70 factor (ECF subfamily)
MGAICRAHSGARPNRSTAMTTAAATATASTSIADIVAHRAYLVRFAMRRLRDPMLAEDAVHDVFEAVLSGRASFGGRSALRSWLTAVLKHKIVDTMRRSPLHESLSESDDGEVEGHDVACHQPGPEQIVEQRQLLARALAGIEALPAGLRDAIRLRAIEERSAESACRELGISEENLFVRVHRARKRLRS